MRQERRCGSSLPVVQGQTDLGLRLGRRTVLFNSVLPLHELLSLLNRVRLVLCCGAYMCDYGRSYSGCS